MVLISKLAEQQARMAPVIAQLRYLQSKYAETLMDRTHKAMDDRAFWTNASAFTNVAKIGGGLLKASASFLPANIGNVAKVAGEGIAPFADIAQSFMLTPANKAASKETLLMQVKLPGANDAKRSKGEMQKETLDAYKEGMRMAHDANTKAIETRN